MKKHAAVYSTNTMFGTNQIDILTKEVTVIRLRNAQRIYLYFTSNAFLPIKKLLIRIKSPQESTKHLNTSAGISKKAIISKESEIKNSFLKRLVSVAILLKSSLFLIFFTLFSVTDDVTSFHQNFSLLY